MNIVDREVITDLLPLYRAGIASPQTRMLVEAHLASDPGLAREAETAAAAEAARAEIELEAYARSRGFLARVRWLFGLAIGFTVLALPVRIHFENGAIADVRLLAMDAPLLFAPLFLAAGACWAGYFVLKRSMS